MSQCRHNRITLSQRLYAPNLCQTQAEAHHQNGGAASHKPCSDCGRYFAPCCLHRGGLRSSFPCHQTRVLYTDGATSNNGYPNARSGLGAAFGDGTEHEVKVFVDDSVDQGPRTNQRSELLAIIHGIYLLRRTGRHRGQRPHAGVPAHFAQPPGYGNVEELLEDWLILSDSEYAVLGVTTRFIENEMRGGVNANGQRAQNYDLMARIVEMVKEEESFGRQVGFAHIPRELNSRVDALAKAARDGR